MIIWEGCMTTLCFPSALTSSEWAAWVQAVGSILAVLGAASIAVWQARERNASALRLQSKERAERCNDLALALYVELAERVARCCFDAEAPWKNYLDMMKCNSANMTAFRLRKFLPDEPIVYQSTAGQIAMLGNNAAQPLLKFYYRLAAWRRDLENMAEISDGNLVGVGPDSVNFLAKRLRQTLAPGLCALQALEPLVDNYAAIEASAIEGYDIFHPASRPKGALRERMERLIN
jgi:hypothetical protein